MTPCLNIENLDELDFVIHDDGKPYVNLKSFFGVLKANSTCDIRVDNLRRTIQTYKDGIAVIDGKDHICYSAILRIIFQNYDKLDVCRTIADDIGLKLLTTKSDLEKTETILDIYKSVACLEFKVIDLLQSSVTDIIQDSDIPTLYQIHKNQFERKEDWEKIKILKWHFSKQNPKNCYLTFENEVAERKKYLNDIKNLLNLQTTIHELCKDTVSCNQKRKDAADLQKGILVTGRHQHIPKTVDESPRELLEDFSIDSLVCVGCTKHVCQHDKGLHIYLDFQKSVSLSVFSDICVLIQSCLSRDHHEHCAEIVAFEHETFVKYGQPTNRFQLHDDWVLGKLSRTEIFSEVLEESEEGTHTSCKICTDEMSLKHPLDSRNLSATFEWIYYVPLLIQILLETFLNMDSVKRSVNVTEYVTGKVQRLYSAFDILLNIFNRCYLGVYQSVASNQLSLSYHHVNTVFSVASQGGLTCSFAESERRLKQLADPTVLYYKSFIEEHAMKYKSSDGSSQKAVSLRDCHLVLCLDNLVRLTFHRDRHRGESRTSQICTLPITIMGIPKDAIDVLSWHSEAICDGTQECPCKKRIILKPTDFENVFQTLAEAEEEQMSFFQMSLTWGLHEMWTAIKDFPEMHTSLERAMKSVPNASLQTDKETIEVDEIDVLNYSMHSLDLSGSGKTIDVDSEKPEKEKEEEKEEYSDNDDGEEDEDNDDDDDEDDEDEDNDDEEEDEEKEEEDDEDEDDEDNDSMLSLPRSDDGSLSPIEVDSDVDSDMHPLDANDGGDEADKVEDAVIENAIESLGFKVFTPPPLLRRHPPPVEGRDDDPKVLREILSDILMKTGKHEFEVDKSRILFAPDNKIGKNLFLISNVDEKFNSFLPEFPLLHLRKSKINNLRSAYEEIGLYQLLGYMQDRELDMKQLLNVEKIEDATRNVRRLSLSLHLAFMVKFIESLPVKDASKVVQILTEGDVDGREHYQVLFTKFLNDPSDATFALHREMMQHCDEILAISIAERIGGPDGYNLLLAAVKSSLPFSFVNGASSYAIFCCQLLHAHYSAGPFHDAMKKTLFSTPYRGSRVNFALDTQREFDHRDAVKGFRPRGTMSSVLPRMSLVDTFAQMTDGSGDGDNNEDPPVKTWRVTRKDVGHIMPTALLILRRGGLDKKEEHPRNVYATSQPVLPLTALDMHTESIGLYLLKRYAHLNGLCGLQKEVPQIEAEEPKDLIRRVRNMKNGYTIRRMKCKPHSTISENEKKEQKRQRKVKQLSDMANSITSETNQCQAVLNPNCTKRNCNKAVGMKKAIIAALAICVSDERSQTTKSNTKDRTMKVEKQLKEMGVVHCSLQGDPYRHMDGVRVAIFEFAGVKFKTRALTGLSYLQDFESNIINRTLRNLPAVKNIIVCEEKYSHTPDLFKAATRVKRTKTDTKTFSHLKRGDDVISQETFDKKAACLTTDGKVITSTFIAANLKNIKPLRPVVVTVDSEYLRVPCSCVFECTCSGSYNIPIQATFAENEATTSRQLMEIHQKKGEAEMAVADWLIEMLPGLEERDAVVSVITSGDIDAIPIHMVALSTHWPRKEDGTFLHPVYIILQKPKGHSDLYNVTKVVEMLERTFGKGSALKVAIMMCIGGNDFMLKFNGISHEKIVLKFLENDNYVKNLITLTGHSNSTMGTINKILFYDFIKELYCPPRFDSSALSFEQIRQLTIQDQRKHELNHPKKWMPPKTALDRVSDLIDYQIEYLSGAGYHSYPLPDFLSKGCLRINEDGLVSYDLGPECHTAKPEELLIPQADLIGPLANAKRTHTKKLKAEETRKRGPEETPQKGRRRKRRPLTSTPSKHDTT